jgi:hypothetical protein
MISILGFSFLSYGLSRDQTLLVQGIYAVLFLTYILLYSQLKSDPKLGIYISLLLRIVLIFSIPYLSDDFNRFIWDSRLLASGINPFHQVPDYYMNQTTTIPGLNQELYESLNYTSYYTMYPTIPQFTGWVAVLIGGDSIFWNVVVMRIFILMAEAASIFLIFKMLKDFGLKSSGVLIYALNPLVILELTGNLHHEAFVILFMLLTVFFFRKNKYLLSAASMSLAIASKLLPLIFLPLFVSRIGLRKVGWYFFWVALSTIILFIPFLDNRLLHALIDSGWLYFQRFEFNGSIYYLVREVGYWVKGYNIIESAGRWLAAITFFSILAYTWIDYKRKPIIFESFMWVLALYLAFTTTLHPWYILPLISFSVFTKYRFPVIWSLLIFLTYAGYSENGYKEPIILISIQYLAVYGMMITELLIKNDIKIPLLKSS